LITLKVLKFQSIQILSIQTLRKIYREVREAGSWPSHTHMPRRVALKPQAERLVPLSLSLSRPIQSPPTRLREGQQFYGLLGNYLLSTGARHHCTRHLYYAISRHLPTANSCSYSDELTSSRSLRNRLAMAMPSPMGKHVIPMYNPVFTYVQPRHTTLISPTSRHSSLKLESRTYRPVPLAGAATTNL
jgi:hypothetical protein